MKLHPYFAPCVLDVGTFRGVKTITPAHGKFGDCLMIHIIWDILKSFAGLPSHHAKHLHDWQAMKITLNPTGDYLFNFSSFPLEAYASKRTTKRQMSLEMSDGADSDTDTLQ